MGCLAQGIANRAHRCTETENQRIQDPHSQPHCRVLHLLLRGAHEYRPITATTCRPPTGCSSDRAIFVSSSQEQVENPAVWLRVRVLNSLVFSFSTTVRAIRDSLREAAHVCAASNLHF